MIKPINPYIQKKYGENSTTLSDWNKKKEGKMQFHYNQDLTLTYPRDSLKHIQYKYTGLRNITFVTHLPTPTISWIQPLLKRLKNLQNFEYKIIRQGLNSNFYRYLAAMRNLKQFSMETGCMRQNMKYPIELVSFIKRSNSLESLILRLTYEQGDNEHVLRIFEQLPKKKSIKYLILDCDFDPERTKNLLFNSFSKIISQNKIIEKMELAVRQFNIKYQEKGLMNFINSFYKCKNQNLKEFDLTLYNIDFRQIEYFKIDGFNPISNLKKLKFLRLYFYRISFNNDVQQDNLIEAISQLKDLETLHLEYTYYSINPEFIGNLSNSIAKKMLKLTKLILHFDALKFKSDDVSQVGECLGQMKQIKNLNLIFKIMHDFTGKNFKQFCCQLYNIPHLERLQIRTSQCSKLTAEGVCDFLETFKNCKSQLQELNLSFEAINLEGLQTILEYPLSIKSLQTIFLYFSLPNEKSQGLLLLDTIKKYFTMLAGVVEKLFISTDKPKAYNEEINELQKSTKHLESKNIKFTWCYYQGSYLKI